MHPEPQERPTTAGTEVLPPRCRLRQGARKVLLQSRSAMFTIAVWKGQPKRRRRAGSSPPPGAIVVVSLHTRGRSSGRDPGAGAAGMKYCRRRRELLRGLCGAGQGGRGGAGGGVLPHAPRGEIELDARTALSRCCKERFAEKSGQAAAACWVPHSAGKAGEGRASRSGGGAGRGQQRRSVAPAPLASARAN